MLAMEKRYLAGFLFWLVGLSSWVTINSLFNELSLMVDDLPEGWQLGTYLAIIIQIANIGPLIYSFIPNSFKTNNIIIFVAYFTMIFSFICMILIGLFWNYTYDNHSIALLICTFGTSMCDCMTSLIFWVFVSWYPSKYISILAMGESSSGIIASILIWIQQLDTNNSKPRFSVKIYFFAISMIFPFSLFSMFYLVKLLNSNYFQDVSIELKNEQGYAIAETEENDTPPPIGNDDNGSDIEPTMTYQIGNEITADLSPEWKFVAGSQISQTQKSEYRYNSTIKIDKKVKLPESSLENNDKDNHTNNNNNNNNKHFYLLFFIIAMLSAIQNGCLPSISSYCLLSYNNHTYVYATTISTFFNPICAIIPGYFDNLFVNYSTIIIAFIMTCIGVSYLIIIALLSPNPIGKGTIEFEIIVIATYILVTSLISFGKTCIITKIKKQLLDYKMENSSNDIMEHAGRAVQIGSCCGASLFFLLVTVLEIFHS